VTPHLPQRHCALLRWAEEIVNILFNVEDLAFRRAALEVRRFS